MGIFCPVNILSTFVGKKGFNMLASSIRRKNARFNKKTKLEKRVAIAKDVLLQLKANKYIATRGVYLHADKPIADIPHYGEVQLQPILLKNNAPKCEVCARGAMFCSAVRLGNNFNINRHNTSCEKRIYSASFENIEKSIFSSSIISKIEEYFENSDHIHENDIDAMIAIMENIIKNKGRFTLKIRF